jgi:inorganic phosphate transporter, PiT family
MGLGAHMGGWCIVHTLGSTVTRLSPMQRACAETAGAITLSGATHLGIPVSTTHTITRSIVGAGAAKRFNSVRWSVANGIHNAPSTMLTGMARSIWSTIAFSSSWVCV